MSAEGQCAEAIQSSTCKAIAMSAATKDIESAHCSRECKSVKALQEHVEAHIDAKLLHVDAKLEEVLEDC